MHKNILLIISFLLLGLAARAAEISLSSVSGHPGEEIEVTVSISSPGNSTALEVDLPMPDGVTFVTGSVAKLASTDHAVSGNIKNGELRLIMHSLSLANLPEGELMSFKLKPGNRPGDFPLDPKIILSDASGIQLPCSAKAGSVKVLSPYIELVSPSIDFGRQPIRGSYARQFTIRNTGNEPLIISEFIPSAEEFSVSQPMPLTIAEGSSSSVTLIYAPTVRSNGISETLTIESNAANGNTRLSIAAIPFSVNELHVMDIPAGNSDETVTVKLRLNNMEPIAGIQAEFTLPSALSFSEGSIKGIGRGANLSVTGSIIDNTLKLVAYSLSEGPLPEGDGEVLSFDLTLNGRSGSYYVNPVNVILSNAGMENMTSATSGKYAQIKSPSISIPASINFGKVAVGAEATASLSIYNAGQAPLTIERIEIPDNIYVLEGQLPLTLSSYETKTLTLKVVPEREGVQSTVVNVYSNDPENRLKTLTFSVDAYEANELTLSGAPNDDYTAYTLNVALENYTEITALQMDVKWIEGMRTSQADMKLTGRCSDHSYSVAAIGEGVYRIIIFSMSNAPFSGNEGDLFSLTFHGTDFTGTTLTTENIILSSANGENYTSPGSSINIIAVNDVKVSEIELSDSALELKATQTATLSATVLPSNAAVKTVSWSSSNPAYATVSDTGEIMAIAIGETVITATANDDSGIKATCTVTVIPTPAESIKISAEGATTLKATETVQLSAIVLPETTTDKSVYWKSDDIKVATVSQDGLVTAVGVGQTTITATNSAGQSDEIIITVVPTPVSGITLSQTSATVQATQSFTLTADILPATATDKSISWKTDNEAVAIVSPEGTVTAIAVGTATITVSANDGSGITATCDVKVIPTPAESIKITPAGATTLKATETVQLSATVLPETTTDKSVSWNSDKPEVAAVSNDGLVTAISVGSATITATNSAGQTDQITITVVETPVASITLNQNEATLKASQTLTLTATVLPTTATNQILEWSSDNTGVATVTREGVVTAVSVGNATITAKATDGTNVSATCQITVEATPAESIKISAAGSTTLKATETVQLSATVLPETTTDKSVSWNSEKPEVATVSTDGLVTAISVGSATITATNSAGQTDEIIITVVPTPVSGITLSQTSATVQATQSFTLTADILPATATDKSVSWKTDNEAVAIVSPEGTVTAIAVGTATITVTANDGSGITATCDVKVIPTPAESIKISAAGSTTLKATETVQLSATVLPETTTDKSVSWNSDKPEVATVSTDGLVTAISVGSAIITATNSAGQTDRLTITVVETPVASITLNQNEATLKASQTLTLTATVLPTTATNQILEWSSDNTGVATVTREGVVTAVSVGNATITARATDGTNVSATCQITVEATLAESIKISAAGSTTLKATETVQLSATVLPETTTDKSVSWNSDKPEVATVSADGLVTAISVGSATITATNSGGQTDRLTITVVETPVASITLNRETASIKIQETLTLIPTISPASATNKEVKWSSDQPTIVSVDSDGKIQALELGTATITCAALDGSGVTAKCIVTVGETAAESIKISAEGSTTLKATETVQLSATVLPETTTDKSVSWNSDKPEVATVSTDGLVTAVSVGSATITATNSAGQTDRITITVVETPVVSITLDRETASIKVQETLTLIPTISPASATNKEVKWSSDQPTIVSVDSDGRIKALELGNATITCAALDGSGVTAKCIVSVGETAAESIKISAAGSTTLKATETVQLSATVLPETTTDKSVGWNSDKPEVAIVSPDGLVTAISVGSATITATNSAGQTDRITITVVETPVASITLNRETASIRVQETLTLTPTIYPATATNKEVEWSSDQPTIVSVDSEGMIKALELGTATITCAALDGSGVTAKCFVTVGETAAESIKISANGSTTLKATETVQLSATVLPETTTDKSVSWNSDKPEVAAVSTDGLVTAISVGSATITATNSAGQTDRITITVVETPVASITLNQNEATLKATQTLTLTATVLPATATNQILEWNSDNIGVATVTQEGVVTAVSVGNATITAKATDGTNISATCQIKVEATPAESIKISAVGSTTLKATETVQLSATVLPETTTDKSVSWNSDKPEVATVSADGLVTAISVGSATITATNSAGQSDRLTITVVETPVASITLNRETAFIRVQETLTLTPTISPATATNKEVEWSSSNEDIVSVDTDGLVTALSLGEAVITVKATDGSEVTATCKVSVIETPAESITITAEGATTLKATETVQLSAMVLPETATDKSVNWRSSDVAVATVNNDGLVTAVSVGTTVITATNSAGQTDQIEITVIPTPVSSIELNASEITLKVSETATLTAVINPETATNKEVDWISDNDEIAAVTPDGVVLAKNVGETRIKAIAKDGSGTTASCLVTVETTNAESIEIYTEGETELKIGEKLQLYATILPETTTDKSIFWQSEMPEIASVDSSGLVTAVSVGKSLIFATNSGGQRDQILITVIDDSGIEALFEEDECFTIYDLNGIIVKEKACRDNIRELQPGIYIIQGRKYLKR